MESSELPFPSFAELALFQIAYGELHGVFRKEDPNTLILDVFLPDPTAEFGRRWQGQIHVRSGNLIEALREFHKQRVLNRFFEHRKAIREGGASHRLSAPPAYEVTLYRARQQTEVVAEIEKEVAAGKARPYFGNSMVMYCLFNERPFHSDASVAIHFVPASKSLILTDIDGGKTEVSLSSNNVEHITARCIEFLACQGIKMLVPELAAAA